MKSELTVENEAGADGEAKTEDVVVNLEPRHADRFDFTFNNLFYALNFQIDEYGERITSKVETMSRIITKDGMAREEETIYSQDEYDEDGNYFPRPDKPIIPVNELK